MRTDTLYANVLTFNSLLLDLHIESRVMLYSKSFLISSSESEFLLLILYICSLLSIDERKSCAGKAETFAYRVWELERKGLGISY